MSCHPGLKRKRLTYKVPGSPGGVGLVRKTRRGIVIALPDPSAPAHAARPPANLPGSSRPAHNCPSPACPYHSCPASGSGPAYLDSRPCPCPCLLAWRGSSAGCCSTASRAGACGCSKKETDRSVEVSMAGGSG